MIDNRAIANSSAFGWLVTVSRQHGVRPVRYYVTIGDERQARFKLRETLHLKDAADVSFRYALSRYDLESLKLSPGEVIRA